MSSEVQWKFSVSAADSDSESLGVVGSCPTLGSWLPENAVILERSDRNQHDGSAVWTGKVKLPIGEEIEYRYFTCVVLEKTEKAGDGDTAITKRSVIMRKWETYVSPRKVLVKEQGNDKMDVFGNYGGKKHVDKGWLTHETLLHFKLMDGAIKIHEKAILNDNIRVQLTPIDLNLIDPNGEMNNMSEKRLDFDDVRQHHGKWPVVEVARMNDKDYLYQRQEQYGVVYKHEEMVIFQCQVLSIESVAFLVNIYRESKDSSEILHLGCSHIMPHQISDSSEGDLKLTIVNQKHYPVGQLEVGYFITRPLPENICNMKISLAKYWDPSWTGLEVGHRGSGSSFKEALKSCSNIRENTLASLKAAADHGADYLEFDVQLSKDLVPVIYHDFAVNVLLKKNDPNGYEKLLVPVKDLTLKQLQGLKFLNKAEDDASNLPDTEDHRPFPTLESLFKYIDEDVGFNVEIKWNMQRHDGTYELEHPIDANLYVDQVVTAVLRHGGSRKIVFSCFHPDICVMLRLKQNKYPVLFLTQGITNKWEPYKDPRTRSIRLAAYFALNADILGINVHAEDILRDPGQVKFAKDHGLTLFCWGEDNNDQEVIMQMKKFGVDGIIYDKFYEYRVNPTRVYSSLNREMKGLVDIPV